MSILNAGRAGSFARPAAETAIDVRLKCLRCFGEPALFDRAHQVDAPARTVILIGGGDVRGTSFETKPAMNAGKDLLLFASESSSQAWVD